VREQLENPACSSGVSNFPPGREIQRSLADSGIPVSAGKVTEEASGNPAQAVSGRWENPDRYIIIVEKQWIALTWNIA
jgi:hypothetical protein